MSETLFKTLPRLVRRQQRRLWSAQLLTRTTLPLGWLVIILFSSGVIHQGWLQLNIPLFFTLALLPPALYLSVVAIRRIPTTADGATAADTQLKAHALFLSAWEITAFRKTPSSTQKLLLTRAAAELPHWQKQLRSKSKQRPGPSLLLGITLAILGSFLLLLPGKVTQKSLESGISDDVKQQQSKDSETIDPVTAINEILLAEKKAAALQHESQAAMQHGKAEDTHSEEKQTGNHSDGQSQEKGNESQMERDKNEKNRKNPADRNIVVSEVGENPGESAERHRGTAPGLDASVRTDQTTGQAAPFTQQRYQDISLDSDHKSQAFDRHTGQHLTTTSQPLKTGLSSADRDITSGGEQTLSTSMTPDQRVLVDRYFKQLSQFDESKP
ncbi:MAG: hypothetical protein DIZ77_13290 [endosymbiont of Seepiophila jonesi]|uniref:Uncharacterized protein n=1 Tax=endosymbiont of Lamellibrachia luymesi TaxID=2200907 RepID=A0A370DSA3_9GAMM|nr:MAG: hypothetical protein DIZ79_15110 [endosymbiont of Lamellibrachia luymesi]RDH90465.1 MAG: hypothetical protein DIZ77_13290 [endosymbiont of Seepiophila jonesi]